MSTNHHGGRSGGHRDSNDATIEGSPLSRTPRVLSIALVIAVLLPASAASAHVRLPPNNYTCFSPDGSQYVNRHLHVKAGREYAFKKGNGDRLGNAGGFAHPSDTNKIRFTSGYLDNHGWR